MPAKTKGSASKKPATKGAIIGELAEATGVKRKQVKEFFDKLAEVAARHLGKHGSGFFSMSGLVKLKAVTKPATPEHMGINPFTKEQVLIKAKPERRVVRAVALKGLKEMAK